MQIPPDLSLSLTIFVFGRVCCAVRHRTGREPAGKVAPSAAGVAADAVFAGGVGGAAGGAGVAGIIEYGTTIIHVVNGNHVLSKLCALAECIPCLRG